MSDSVTDRKQNTGSASTPTVFLEVECQVAKKVRDSLADRLVSPLHQLKVSEAVRCKRVTDRLCSTLAN